MAPGSRRAPKRGVPADPLLDPPPAQLPTKRPRGALSPTAADAFVTVGCIAPSKTGAKSSTSAAKGKVKGKATVEVKPEDSAEVDSEVAAEEAALTVESGQETDIEKQLVKVSKPDGEPTFATDEEVFAEFKRQRDERIARNKALMAQLSLPGLALAASEAGAKAKSGAAIKGMTSQNRSRAPKSAVPAAPQRASLRARGFAADPVLAAGVENESARGGVVLAAAAGTRSIWGAHGARQRAAAAPAGMTVAVDRHPTGSRALVTENGTTGSDASFLAALKVMLSGCTSYAPGPGPLRASDMPKLQLRETDVAKVCKEGATHLAWQPGPGPLLLAAGDKSGRLALWQVDYDAEKDEDHGDGFDGVATFAGMHNQYISGLAWLPSPGSSVCSKIISASYDGSIRMLDVEQGSSTDLSKGIRDDMEISALEVHPCGSVAYVADNLGNMDVLDLRAGSRVGSSLMLHTRRVNSLHLEPLSQRLLMSAGTDAAVRIWDVRQLRSPTGVSVADKLCRPVCKVDHYKSCHGAYWAPDGSQRILTTSFDDTVRIWVPGEMNAPAPGSLKIGTSGPVVDVMQDGPEVVKCQLSCTRAASSGNGLIIKHVNQTGRWVTPFKAVWGAACDWVAIGSMTRGADVFDAGTGQHLAVLQSEFQTAIPPRMAAHPTAPVLAAATSSGRVHIWR